jgi:hypothetical protein
MVKRGLAGLLACLALLPALGCSSNSDGSSAAPKVDGIPCETSERLTYHVHAHLTILNQGQPVPVPAGTGIPGNRCIYWLHTHDTSGVIHIEAPSQRGFTLGNFFDIWQQPLSADHVAGMTADAQHSFQFYVDGKPYSGDPRAIPLGPHTQITIEYGPPFSEPPGFTFPAGL